MKPSGERKQNKGKFQPRLVPVEAIEDIARVCEYGNSKYDANIAWDKLDPNQYIDALYRHLLHVVEDRYSMDESGLEHYKHLACNAAFLCKLLRMEHNKDDYNRHRTSTGVKTNKGTADAHDADASNGVRSVQEILQDRERVQDT